MLYRKYIEEAFKITWALYYQAVHSSGDPPEESSAISMLVFDIFGGEILKTPIKNGWYFYNRFEGENFDFSKSNKNDFPKCTYFENLSSTPEEPHKYFDEEDYSSLFIRFLHTYEEVVSHRS